MNKKPKWARKLTTKELKHLAASNSSGRPTLGSLKANLADQAASGIVCWECRAVATKLGLHAS